MMRKDIKQALKLGGLLILANILFVPITDYYWALNTWSRVLLAVPLLLGLVHTMQLANVVYLPFTARKYTPLSLFKTIEIFNGHRWGLGVTISRVFYTIQLENGSTPIISQLSYNATVPKALRIYPSWLGRRATLDPLLLIVSGAKALGCILIILVFGRILQLFGA